MCHSCPLNLEGYFLGETGTSQGLHLYTLKRAQTLNWFSQLLCYVCPRSIPCMTTSSGGVCRVANVWGEPISGELCLDVGQGVAVAEQQT